MKKIFLFSAVLLFSVAFTGCLPVEPVVVNLTPQGDVVFTRPFRWQPFFGSYSANEYIELTHRNAYRNDAGHMVVQVGIRNRGAESWTNWFVTTKKYLYLDGKINFFEGDRNSQNKKIVNLKDEFIPITIRRGDTYWFEAVAPTASCSDFQLILSESGNW